MTSAANNDIGPGGLNGSLPVPIPVTPGGHNTPGNHLQGVLGQTRFSVISVLSTIDAIASASPRA